MPSRSSVEPRRSPQQARSQKRVEDILSATKALVGERGNDAVSMREIAAEAGVPVSSVYQYFPDKNALLRELMRRYMVTTEQHILAAFSTVRCMEDFLVAVPKLIDELVGMFSREPDLATIWGCVQANAVLRDYDMQDSREKAQMLAALACSLAPDADPEDLRDMTHHIVHTAFFVLRVSHQSPQAEGERLIREQKRLIDLRIRSVMEPATD